MEYELRLAKDDINRLQEKLNMQADTISRPISNGDSYFTKLIISYGVLHSACNRSSVQWSVEHVLLLIHVCSTIIFGWLFVAVMFR